eukprot:7535873-Pyramimonas_sp.AAC.2
MRATHLAYLSVSSPPLPVCELTSLTCKLTSLPRESAPQRARRREVGAREVGGNRAPKRETQEASGSLRIPRMVRRRAAVRDPVGPDERAVGRLQRGRRIGRGAQSDAAGAGVLARQVRPARGRGAPQGGLLPRCEPHERALNPPLVALNPPLPGRLPQRCEPPEQALNPPLVALNPPLVALNPPLPGGLPQRCEPPERGCGARGPGAGGGGHVLQPRRALPADRRAGGGRCSLQQTLPTRRTRRRLHRPKLLLRRVRARGALRADGGEGGQ